MQFFSKKKGFTLIELLVVIAIIGILAAIVLVSLAGARDRAKTARIESSLAQYRSLSEMCNTADNSSYANVCTTGTTAYSTEKQSLWTDMQSMGGTVTCTSSATKYCIQSTLPSTPNVWCVDSAGHSKNATCTALACP
jgi:type IV pilus assembly protein PilA